MNIEHKNSLGNRILGVAIVNSENTMRQELLSRQNKMGVRTNSFVNTVVVLKCDEAEPPGLASVFVGDQINTSNFTIAGKGFTDHVLCCVFFHSTNKHLLHRLL